VGPPSCLHDIALRREGRKSGTGPPSHDIDDDTGNFSDDSKAQVLLHQRKSWATGRRHRFHPCERGTDHCAQASNLILHLDKGPGYLRKSDGKDLRDLRGWGDRIACKKTAACPEGSLDHGFIPLKQQFFPARRLLPWISTPLLHLLLLSSSPLWFSSPR